MFTIKICFTYIHKILIAWILYHSYRKRYPIEVDLHNLCVCGVSLTNLIVLLFSLSCCAIVSFLFPSAKHHAFVSRSLYWVVHCVRWWVLRYGLRNIVDLKLATQLNSFSPWWLFLVTPSLIRWGRVLWLLWSYFITKLIHYDVGVGGWQLGSSRWG